MWFCSYWIYFAHYYRNSTSTLSNVHPVFPTSYWLSRFPICTASCNTHICFFLLTKCWSEWWFLSASISRSLLSSYFGQVVSTIYHISCNFWNIWIGTIKHSSCIALWMSNTSLMNDHYLFEFIIQHCIGLTEVALEMWIAIQQFSL